MFYNYKQEKIFYINQHEGKGILHVFLAGITTPNAKYKSTHNTNADNLFDKYQFEYVFGGKGIIETPGKKYEIGAGDFFFLNKSKPHIYYSDKENPLEKIFVTVSGTLVDRLTEAYSMKESVIIRKVNVYTQLSRILEILSKMDSETISTDIDDIGLILHEIIQKVHPLCPEKIELPTEAEKMKNYIENNLDRNFTLEDMSSFFFQSKISITRIFKSNYHTTPMRYTLERKLQVSKHLLYYTDLRIEDISNMLAFSSGKHFSKAFKNVFGLAPSEYRKSLFSTDDR